MLADCSIPLKLAPKVHTGKYGELSVIHMIHQISKKDPVIEQNLPRVLTRAKRA
jgi:hypothetical protein